MGLASAILGILYSRKPVLASLVTFFFPPGPYKSKPLMALNEKSPDL
jgi:hypothetical protein